MAETVRKPQSVPTPTEADVTRLLTYRISVLARQLARSGGAFYLNELGLSLPQWRAVSALGTFGELTITDIAERIMMDRGQTSRTVDMLMQAGLIRLRPDVADGRRTLLSLSPEGERRYAAGLPLALKRQGALLAGFTAAEVAAFDAMLDRLLANTSDGRDAS